MPKYLLLKVIRVSLVSSVYGTVEIHCFLVRLIAFCHCPLIGNVLIKQRNKK